MTSISSAPIIDPQIFQKVQQDIDLDLQAREDLRKAVTALDRDTRSILSVLAQAHSTPNFPELSVLSHPLFCEQKSRIKELENIAASYPYYRYYDTWNRAIQQASFAVILMFYLENEALATLDQVSRELGVPSDVVEDDKFHLSVEDYLHAIISLINELSRLAVNSVTMQDFKKPLKISTFVKELHSAFSLLNLKNDSLRRRFDSIKYDVKKVEEVVYDLTIRGLIKNQSKRKVEELDENQHA